MLYKVTGPAGSGKTEYLYGVLADICASGGQCIWISPEQQSVQVEREILSRLGDGSNLSVELLNFERLPERIAREYGDLAVTYPDKGALCALLSVLAQENKEQLREYAACTEDASFLEELFLLFGRLRSECVSPEQVRSAAEQVQEDEHVQRKLADVGLLYEAYDAYFDETRKDPRDALTVLANTLEEKPFFVEKTVFVDGYYTFTGQEYALLAGILRQADAVYCSFTCDGRELFAAHEQSAFRLTRHANGFKEIAVGAYRRSVSEELRFLEAYLWSEQTPTFAGDTGAVSVWRAPDVFAESEAVAAEILRLVRGGMRYREITVLARHAERYAGVLDAVLAQNRIPFFFSSKEELLTNPLCAFLCASLELLLSDFAPHAMRKYLKSGYSGRTPEECDLLLRYAESWRLRGKAWYRQEDWVRNPDGYREGGMDEQQQDTLAATNAARKLLLPTLLQWRQEALQAQNGKELLCAWYAQLERVGAAERYTQAVNDALERGDVQKASRDSQLWELLMRIFEQLESLIGQKPLHGKQGLRKLLSLFCLTAKQYSLGSIPSSLDSVTVGEAALTRPDHARALIVMGCNDGVFPSTVGGNTLFDDTEAGILEGVGISVIDSLENRLRQERFYFYNAVASPSEKLIFTYPEGTLSGEELRISPALLRVRKLLPHLEEQVYTGTRSQALFSAENAFAVFSSLEPGEERERLRALLEEQGMCPPGEDPSLFLPEARIAYEGSSVRFSPSSIERYRFCPFSYFGSHLLRLKEKKVNRFATPEIGSFLHKMLEQFLVSHTQSGRFVPPENALALDAEADALMREYFAEITNGTQEQSARFLHTCRNLKKTLLLLLSKLSEEFANSDFLPIGFEVGIGLPGGQFPPATFERGDGKTVYLCGSIDRVDRYDRDGNGFIRVVDYKTYSKQLSLANARAYGLDEQMLLYLFAYCRCASDGQQPLRPAGVLYDLAVLPFADSEGEETEQELQSMREQKLKRSGLILEDADVASAMDRTISGRFVPISFDEDGNLKPGKNTLPAEGFDELQTLLEQQLQETASQVFAGNMDISPLRLNPETDACKYCKLRAFCRRS